MNLYLLQEREGLSRHVAPGDPWAGHYDLVNGAIVRAGSEDEARSLLSTQAMDEGPNAWLNPALSTCEILAIEGISEIIIKDCSNG